MGGEKGVGASAPGPHGTCVYSGGSEQGPFPSPPAPAVDAIPAGNWWETNTAHFKKSKCKAAIFTVSSAAETRERFFKKKPNWEKNL